MESPFIEVHKRSGERLRRYLAEHGLLNRGALIRSEGDKLQIPITREPDGHEVEEIREITGHEPVVKIGEFNESQRQRKIEDILGFNPSFEVIGDIAVMSPPDKIPVKEAAEAILAIHKGIKTVVIPTGPVSGDWRVRPFEWVAGEPIHEVCVREYGMRFRLDIERVYFSPRLATERHRVATQVRPHELVVDMFAGVGPFTVSLAKRAKKVIAIDKNPYAIRYLKENLSLNRIENVEVREGDVREVTSDLIRLADRVIMNLPLHAFEFLPLAVKIAKPGGIIHYYDITGEEDLFDSLLRRIRDAIGEVKVLNRRVVRSYAPRLYNVVLDIAIMED
ncbi:MAG TPA: class I SAM-dependent methyltransferase family protein [Candidatus Syntrophoarchaeum butanivorans]|uniref:Class I SAM-dependent methyltransferase family protein n=1 Tax=Candidatus Syntropharchaeum butanivorans TaxID=1839936 RepID=A0A7C1B345_9EURY|nr:class I SAM-dependent methyltransferase family protein [Candidatus Syntrophoarchaeum butanivorans]